MLLVQNKQCSQSTIEKEIKFINHCAIVVLHEFLQCYFDPVQKHNYWTQIDQAQNWRDVNKKPLSYYLQHLFI